MLRICTRAGLPPYQWRIGSYDHTISYHCALSFVSLGNYCHVHSSVLILFLLLQCHVVLLFLYNTLNFYTVLVLLSVLLSYPCTVHAIQQMYTRLSVATCIHNLCLVMNIQAVAAGFTKEWWSLRHRLMLFLDDRNLGI